MKRKDGATKRRNCVEPEPARRHESMNFCPEVRCGCASENKLTEVMKLMILHMILVIPGNMGNYPIIHRKHNPINEFRRGVFL